MSSGRRRPERSDGITVFTVAVARNGQPNCERPWSETSGQLSITGPCPGKMRLGWISASLVQHCQPSQNAAVEDPHVSRHDKVAGEQGAGLLVQDGEIIIRVRRTPGLQAKSPRSKIQSQRVVDELRRRNELPDFFHRLHGLSVLRAVEAA